MKKYTSSFLPIVFLMLLAISCKKYDDNATPDTFDVTTAKQTYKVGDTVLFNLNSGPDMIVFYSGEAGKTYANKDRTVQAGVPKLVFQVNMQQGLLPNNDSLRLYISNNLKGYDSANVVNATWTDISAKNTKWPTALSASFITSDSITLTEFNNADSINLAFRATGKKYATAQQRKWQIQNLTLTNFLTDGSSTALFNTFANTGFTQANIKNNITPSLTATNYNAWNVGQAGVNATNSTLVISGKACNSSGLPIQTAYPITFDPSALTNVDDNDDWLITSAINLKSVKPDVGITIKNEVNAAFAGMNYLYFKTPGIYAQYQYKFTTPGTYTVVFVARNLNDTKSAEVVKQLQLIITP